MQSMPENLSPDPTPHERASHAPLVVPVRAVVAALAVAALVLAALGIAADYLSLGAAAGGAGGLVSTRISRLFTLDGEGGIPAWFQAALLLASAALFWLASARREAGARHPLAWRALAAIFVLLSCDEISGMHETFGFWLAPRVGRSVGVYAWLLGGIPFVAILGLALRRFVRDLPPRTRAGLLLAAGLYLAGVVGVELFEAAIDARLYGTLAFALVAAVEECLESAGLIVLVGTLLGHLRAAGPVRLEPR